jgi:transposase
MAAQRKYPDELRERAVKMVLEIRERDGKGHGELARVGRQPGVHPEACGPGSSRRKLTAASGRVPRLVMVSGSRSSSGKCASCAGRTGEILKAASAYFARELHPRLPRWSGSLARTGTGSASSRVCAVLEFPVSSYYYARKRETEPAARETATRS